MGKRVEKCSVCGAERTTEIDIKDHDYQKVVLNGGYRKNGKIVTRCSICKKIKKTHSTIPMVYIVKASSKVKYGNPVKTKVLKENKKALSKKYYSVTKINNKKIGTQTLTFKFKGLYGGEVARKVAVIPSNIKITGLSAKKTSITVNYSNAKGDVKYQIAVKKKGGDWKKFSSAKLKKKIPSLKSGTKYKVKVRAYKTVSGKNYCGNWSKPKSITTKGKAKKSGGDITVYVTASGKKYHSDKGCSGLRRANNIYSKSLADAKSAGYTPCNICYFY